MSCPEKGCARTIAFKLGWSSLPNERFEFEGGSGNSPFEAAGFAKDDGFMIEKDKRKLFLFL